MSTKFPGADLLLYWIKEREAVRLKREAGVASPPWSDDPVFQRERFCNVERESDTTTRWIRENWREPFHDDPDVWFLLAIARLGGNEPRTLDQITPPLPWNKERYLAEMEAKQLRVGRRGYRTIISRIRGQPTHVHLAHNVFDLLWAERERVRPKPGDTCYAFFSRLREFDGLGGTGFLAGQITVDTKFTPLLLEARDWWDFATRGEGSGPGLNVVMGRAYDASWTDASWNTVFAQLRAEVSPQVEETLGRRLSASDLQSCLCEVSKLWRAREESSRAEAERRTPRAINLFRLRNEAPKPRKRESSTPANIEPKPAPAAKPPKPYARTLFEQLARPFIMPSSDRGEGLRLIFDLESDGLLDAVTRVHCIVIGDLDSDRVHEYGPDQIQDALAHLARADVLIGHNIQGYDLPALRKLYGWTPPSACRIVDTLVAARLILPHLGTIDGEVAARAKDLAFGQVRGRNSLEAWGLRLGMPKVGAELHDWSQWTPAVQARCVGDVVLCKRLWLFLQPDGYCRSALDLEHRVAAICDQITVDGVPFDTTAAEHLREHWEARRAALEVRLREQFPELGNLNSRIQIAALLDARGWQPERRTEKTGQPVIDDELLESLPAIYPEFAGLAEHYILGRRLGQLSNGAQAWTSNVHPTTGRIHGGLIHIGTPHSRAKHLQPNIAQVPNPKKGGAFAAECRALFRHPDWVFVTCDQSNLQDRGFAHYLAAHDGGAYARIFADGIDQHWRTAIALGLVPEGTERDKDSKVHTAIREGAKTFRYAFLFGAGALRAGQIIADIVRTVAAIAPENPLSAQFWTGDRHPNEVVLRQTGRRVLDRFTAAAPGLRELRARLTAEHRRRGWVEGLDGRRVPTDADYKALNRIVTAAEAVICKRWLIDVHAELCSRFRYGPDGDAYLALWIHDELVACCRPAVAEQVGEILVRHARKAGEHYRFRVPLNADLKIGRDWTGTPLEEDAAQCTSSSSLPAELTDTAPTPEPPAVTPATPEPPAVAAPKINGTPSLIAQTKAPIALPQRGGLIDQPLGNGKIRCPFHADRTPSCHLYADGHYHCFGCGAHGSIHDLGLDDEVLAKLATHESQDEARTLELALALWAEAKPIAGTLAERYLADTRKIDLARVLPSDIDAVLRFHPRCPFNPGTRHPCLLALFRDVESDAPAGIHRIALTPDAQKIGRLTLGRWIGTRTIKLWPLASEQVIGEGLETVLAGMQVFAHHDKLLRPAWAMGPKDGIAKLPILFGVERLTILVDNDTNGVGPTSAKKCAERWIAAGRSVRLLTTKHVKDFNDLALS